jgi:hypothetical protein
MLLWGHLIFTILTFSFEHHLAAISAARWRHMVKEMSHLKLLQSEHSQLVNNSTNNSAREK